MLRASDEFLKWIVFRFSECLSNDKDRYEFLKANDYRLHDLQRYKIMQCCQVGYNSKLVDFVLMVTLIIFSISPVGNSCLLYRPPICNKTLVMTNKFDSSRAVRYNIVLL